MKGHGQFSVTEIPVMYAEVKEVASGESNMKDLVNHAE